MGRGGVVRSCRLQPYNGGNSRRVDRLCRKMAVNGIHGEMAGRGCRGLPGDAKANGGNGGRGESTQGSSS